MGRGKQHRWLGVAVTMMVPMMVAMMALASTGPTASAALDGVPGPGSAGAVASRVTTPPPHFPTARTPGPGEVALTFDDGPRPPYTNQVISILQHEHVPATFFVVGSVAVEHPDTLRLMAKLGYSVQNHSWYHKYLVNLTDSQLVAELQRVDKLIRSATGVQPTVLRPPYGLTSPRLVRLASSVGLETVLWNAQAPTMNANARTILGAIEGSAAHRRRDGVGLTVLLHDGSGSSGEMVAALPYLISYLRETGWKFVQLG